MSQVEPFQTQMADEESQKEHLLDNATVAKRLDPVVLRYKFNDRFAINLTSRSLFVTIVSIVFLVLSFIYPPGGGSVPFLIVLLVLCFVAQVNDWSSKILPGHFEFGLLSSL